MTNKESIQQKQLEALNHTWDNRVKAIDYTTITAEAIVEAMEWVGKEGYWFYKTHWFHYANESVTTTELIQLFLNQKAKI